MNRQSFRVAIFEIFRMVLVDRGMLDKSGKPIKNSKAPLVEQDAISLYKWLGEDFKRLKQVDFDTARDEFNLYARGMKDEVYLNMYLMSMFLMDKYVEDEPKSTQLLIGGKIDRIIKYMRMKIIEVEKRGPEIITDSSMAASNIFRRYNGQAELTRDVRELRLKQWREASKKSKKK